MLACPARGVERCVPEGVQRWELPALVCVWGWEEREGGEGEIRMIGIYRESMDRHQPSAHGAYQHARLVLLLSRRT